MASIWSMACIAVVGSFTPGETPFRAMSESCLRPKAKSCPKERSLPRTIASRAPSSLRGSRPPSGAGHTFNSGSPPATKRPGPKGISTTVSSAPPPTARATAPATASAASAA